LDNPVEIHVCPLSQLDITLQRSGARHVISLLGRETVIPELASLQSTTRIRLDFNDISQPREGYVEPSHHHVEQLIDFARQWHKEGTARHPLLVHCWMGVSRSTAAALIIAAALVPQEDENDLAQDLRAYSPTATPNARMIALADDCLRRQGRLVEAVKSIGRGTEAFEGAPFKLVVGSPGGRPG
jgi:predicted protein tyrosine phosphatase